MWSVKTALEDVWHCMLYIIMKPLPAYRGTAEDHAQMLCQDTYGRKLFPTQPLVALRCSVARITSSKDLIRPWELWSMMSLSSPSISVLADSWKALHEMTNRGQMQSKTFQVH